MLATWPARTGSVPVLKIIGIAVVADFAATIEGSPPTVTITATRWRTTSAAMAGSLSSWFSAERYSTTTLAFDETLSFQPQTKSGQIVLHGRKRRQADESDHWFVRLLRTQSERPCERRTGHPYDEIASTHCMPRSKDRSIVTV